MIEIETTDIKASSTVSRILWTLLDVIYAGDDTEDMEGFNDKLLLEDVLRFGTIAEVARLKGGNYSWYRQRVEDAVLRLSDRAEHVGSLEKRLAASEDKAKAMNLELIDLKVELHQVKTLLTQTQKRCSKAESQLSDTKVDLSQSQRLLSQSQDELSKTSAALDQSTSELIQLRTHYDKAKAEISTLQRKKASQESKALKSAQASLKLKDRLEKVRDERNSAREEATQLRRSNRKAQKSADNYKKLYEAALETIGRQKAENQELEYSLIEKYCEEHEEERKRKRTIKTIRLKRRIRELEKKLKLYKHVGLSALLDFEPEDI